MAATKKSARVRSTPCEVVSYMGAGALGVMGVAGAVVVIGSPPTHQPYRAPMVAVSDGSHISHLNEAWS
jgi:hypothetical protein